MSCAINEDGVHWCANCEQHVDDGDDINKDAELAAAQAACVSMREALRGVKRLAESSPNGPAFARHFAHRGADGAMMVDAALATDAGAPVLALLDECAEALDAIFKAGLLDHASGCPCPDYENVAPEGCECNRDALPWKKTSDLLTRLKAWRQK